MFFRPLVLLEVRNLLFYKCIFQTPIKIKRWLLRSKRFIALLTLELSNNISFKPVLFASAKQFDQVTE